MTEPDKTTPDKRSDGLTGRQAYNAVTDTVMGPNIRLKDNVIQSIIVVLGLVLGATIGAVVVEARLAGALVGGFIGMVVGLFGSGIFLMVYRAVMHIRGRHD